MLGRFAGTFKLLPPRSIEVLHQAHGQLTIDNPIYLFYTLGIIRSPLGARMLTRVEACREKPREEKHTGDKDGWSTPPDRNSQTRLPKSSRSGFLGPPQGNLDHP